ncbi:hypothetical protein [Nocardiopsis sp. NPDC006938]|uniref:hypothetical protein n=1 Tax=Nocardiopsis sp. NPDC006938 TaxID=3364337 RepID=UPI0036BDAA4C
MSHTETLPAFLNLLAATYAKYDVAATPLPPAVVRLPLPSEDGEERYFDMDCATILTDMESVPAEEHPDYAQQIVFGMMRQLRSRGMAFGTHYPPLSGDHVRRALLAAFAQRGFDARFHDPQTVVVSRHGGQGGDVGPATLRVHRYLSAVEEAGEHEAERLASAYLDEVEADLASGTATEVPVERLRVRVYRRDAIPAEALDSLVTRALTPELVEAVVVDHPRSIALFQRRQLGDLTPERAFAAAVENSLVDPFEVSENDLLGTPIIHIGGPDQEYTLAHLHVLDRYLGEAPHGALVVVPSPPVVMAHVLGRGHPVAAMEHMQDLVERFVSDAPKPVSSKLYWWHPSSGAKGFPDLREVAVEVDHEKRSVTLHAGDDEFRELLGTLMRG